jgi:hypothetical protein
MGTFISSLILYGFAAAVLGLVGKLIYDIQQTKKENKESENEFDKDALQKLAGIIPTNPNDEVRQFLVNNNIIDEEKLKEELRKGEFPAPDPSIPVITAKLTTIGGDYGDSDPLASVPMSRISKEAKQKMAEIAKADIGKQLEKNADKFEALNGGQKACGCGRSETGFCTGLHRISKKDWANGVREIPQLKKKTTKKTK